MIDNFISSTEERFQALKNFILTSNYFYMLWMKIICPNCLNDIQALCLKVAKAVGFEETDGLELLEEVKSFYFTQ